MKTRDINIKIHEESDLYASFDPQQKLLSEDLILYLARNYLNEHRSVQEQYVLHFYSDTPVDGERIKRRISEYYTKEMENLNCQLRNLTVRAIWLAVIGAILLTLWVVLSASTTAVRGETFCIMGWVPIWEATNIVIIERPEVHRMQLTYKKAINAEVIVEENGGDGAGRRD